MRTVPFIDVHDLQFRCVHGTVRPDSVDDDDSFIHSLIVAFVERATLLYSGIMIYSTILGSPLQYCFHFLTSMLISNVSISFHRTVPVQVINVDVYYLNFNLISKNTTVVYYAIDILQMIAK